MKQITADTEQIAYCGLYCGACKKYRLGKCPGCAGNNAASWCGIRSCCIEHEYKSCADCSTYTDVNACGTYNNFVAKVIGFLLRSNRSECIRLIQRHGYDAFAVDMASKGLQTIRR